MIEVSVFYNQQSAHKLDLDLIVFILIHATNRFI